jgi:hypothetical protein
MDTDPMEVDLPSSVRSRMQDRKHSEESTGEDDEDSGWKRRIELLVGDFEEHVRKPRGKMNKRCDERENVIRWLLEMEMLLGQSIDEMRDCLLRFKAAGYSVNHDLDVPR